MQAIAPISMDTAPPPNTSHSQLAPSSVNLSPNYPPPAIAQLVPSALNLSPNWGFDVRSFLKSPDVATQQLIPYGSSLQVKRLQSTMGNRVESQPNLIAPNYTEVEAIVVVGMSISRPFCLMLSS
ncbi:hypothetical protein TIFTF001_029965 [Ficus carica]|uniref:Uncharacterized protein n=1 Tax=Ficus carica TaxID=3494 RepID=A0AA88J489_FICCA|nr:hypothetical protein TIFTF001_029965 [Ficus carica]